MFRTARSNHDRKAHTVPSRSNDRTNDGADAVRSGFAPPTAPGPLPHRHPDRHGDSDLVEVAPIDVFTVDAPAILAEPPTRPTPPEAVAAPRLIAPPQVDGPIEPEPATGANGQRSTGQQPAAQQLAAPAPLDPPPASTTVQPPPLDNPPDIEPVPTAVVATSSADHLPAAIDGVLEADGSLLIVLDLDEHVLTANAAALAALGADSVDDLEPGSMSHALLRSLLDHLPRRMLTDPSAGMWHGDFDHTNASGDALGLPRHGHRSPRHRRHRPWDRGDLRPRRHCGPQRGRTPAASRHTRSADRPREPPSDPVDPP